MNEEKRNKEIGKSIKKISRDKLESLAINHINEIDDIMEKEIEDINRFKKRGDNKNCDNSVKSYGRHQAFLYNIFKLDPSKQNQKNYKKASAGELY